MTSDKNALSTLKCPKFIVDIHRTAMQAAERPRCDTNVSDLES